MAITNIGRIPIECALCLESLSMPVNPYGLNTYVYCFKKNDFNGERVKFYHAYCFEEQVAGENVSQKYREHNFKCNICATAVRDSYYTMLIIGAVADNFPNDVRNVAQFCIDCFECMAGDDFFDPPRTRLR